MLEIHSFIHSLLHQTLRTFSVLSAALDLRATKVMRTASLWGEGKFLLFKGSDQIRSIAQSCPTLRPHESQHARPPCPSPTPGVHSDSRPSSQ